MESNHSKSKSNNHFENTTRSMGGVCGSGTDTQETQRSTYQRRGTQDSITNADLAGERERSSSDSMNFDASDSRAKSEKRRKSATDSKKLPSTQEETETETETETTPMIASNNKQNKENRNNETIYPNHNETKLDTETETETQTQTQAKTEPKTVTQTTTQATTTPAQLSDNEDTKEIEDLLDINNMSNGGDSTKNTNNNNNGSGLSTRDTEEVNNSSYSLTGSEVGSRRNSQSTIDRAAIIAEQLKNSGNNSAGADSSIGGSGSGGTSSSQSYEIIGSLPDTIDTPNESSDVASIGKKGFESDTNVLNAILKEFETESKTLKIEKNTFYRFVIGYRHIKDEKERITTTMEHLNTYFRVHKSLNFDNLLNDPSQCQSTAVEMEGWPVYIYGQDRQGHILMWDEIGSVNVKKLDLAFGNGRDFSALQLHRARLMRRLENLKYQCQKKYNCDTLYKHSMVFDLKHFSLSKHGAKERRSICKRVIEEMTNMYPEAVFRIYVLNAPGAFRAFFQILKLFMDPITADKTRVLGKNYLKELKKDMDISMIPKKYGGQGIWNVQYSDAPKGYPMNPLVGM